MVTLEKIIFLKSTHLFGALPDDIIASVAASFKEHSTLGGGVLLKKGDFGSTMYVIVSGQVIVHDDDHEIARLGRGEVFGELAALSPEKRMASVTALEETLLLKLGSADLYALMDLNVALAKGLIEVLCQRLRSFTQKPA